MTHRLNVVECPVCGQEDPRTLYPCFEEFHIVKCSGCQLVYSTLTVDKKILQRMYDEQYYHTETRDFYYFQNRVTEPSMKEDNPNLKEFLAGLSLIETYKPAGRLLDLGCAVGVFLYLARERGWDVTGIDVSPFATAYANKTFELNAISGELEEKRFPDKYFDVVTLWDVIEHFPDPIRTLREVKRILKDDGIILVDTPNEDSLLKLLAGILFRASGNIISYPVRKMYHQFHLTYFTSRTLELVLKKSGFRMDRLDMKPICLLKARGNPYY